MFICNADPDRTGRGPFDNEYTPDLKEKAAAGEKFIVLPVDAKGRPLERTLVHLEDVCKGLAGLGVVLDSKKNKRMAACVSAASSKIKVLVIPTNEELMIALETASLLSHR
jgi:hypothetical protein